MSVVSRLRPLSRARRASPPARQGIAIVMALLILIAMLSAGALLYVRSLAAQRRASRTANAGATRYAAQAGLQAMNLQVLNAAQLGRLTRADSATIVGQAQPVISGITYPEWLVERTQSAATPVEASDLGGAMRGMQQWTTGLTLTVTARGTNGGQTRMRQRYELVAIPFFQAAVTALGDAEITTQDTAATVQIEGRPSTSPAVPAYRGGALWVYGAGRVTLTGGSTIFGGPYLRRKVNTRLLLSRAGGVFRTSRRGSTPQDFPWDVATVGTDLPNQVNAVHSGNYQWLFTRRPLPTSPVLPPCQSTNAPGLFGLECRSPSRLVGDTLDVRTWTTATAPTGIVHVRPRSGGAVTLKNAESFPANMTVVSRAPLILRGDVNTVARRGLALISPMIFVEKPAIAGAMVTIRAVLIGGYQVSTSGSYRGGFTSALPAVRDLDWGSGEVGYPKGTIYVYGAVIGVPTTTGPFVPTPIYDPHRIYRFDPALLRPANWPPGVFGRVTLRPPVTDVLAVP